MTIMVKRRGNIIKGNINNMQRKIYNNITTTLLINNNITLTLLIDIV